MVKMWRHSLPLVVTAVALQLGAGGCSAESGTDVTDLPALLHSLCEMDAKARQHAATTLGRSYPPGARAGPVLQAALGDDDPEVRLAASEALMALGLRGVEDLARFLLDPGEPGHRAFVETVGMIHMLGCVPGVTDLAKPGAHGDVTASLALTALMDVPEAVVLDTVLLAHASHAESRSPEVEKLACAALAVRGSRAAGTFRRRNGLSPQSHAGVPAALRECLSHDSPVVRWGGTRLLASLEGSDPEVLGLLRKLDADSDASVRNAARKHLTALGATTTRQPEVATRWKAKLKDSSRAVRERAAIALAWSGGDATEAVPVLFDLLRNTRPGSARFVKAAEALGRIGPAAKDAVSALDYGLRAEDAATRLATAVALFRIQPGDELALSNLAELLRDPNPDVAVQALRAVGDLGPSAKPLAPVVIAVLGNSSGATQLTVLKTLAGMEADSGEAVAALTGRLRTLVDLPPPPTQGVFDKLVRTGWNFEADRGSLVVILDMLARIGPPAPESIPLLRELSASADDRIRYRAALSLRRIED